MPSPSQSSLEIWLQQKSMTGSNDPVPISSSAGTLAQATRSEQTSTNTSLANSEINRGTAALLGLEAEELRATNPYALGNLRSQALSVERESGTRGYQVPTPQEVRAQRDAFIKQRLKQAGQNELNRIKLTA